MYAADKGTIPPIVHVEEEYSMHIMEEQEKGTVTFETHIMHGLRAQSERSF